MEPQLAGMLSWAKITANTEVDREEASRTYVRWMTGGTNQSEFIHSQRLLILSAADMHFSHTSPTPRASPPPDPHTREILRRRVYELVESLL